MYLLQSCFPFFFTLHIFICFCSHTILNEKNFKKSSISAMGQAHIHNALSTETSNSSIFYDTLVLLPENIPEVIRVNLILNKPSLVQLL